MILKMGNQSTTHSVKIEKIAKTLEVFFKTYVSITHTLYGLKLTKNQIYVLSELLCQNYLYRNIPVKERSNIIFTVENKEKMINRIGITKGTFDNILTLFRTIKGIYGTILNKKEINQNYMYIPTQVNTINITINIPSNLINDKV